MHILQLVTCLGIVQVSLAFFFYRGTSKKASSPISQACIEYAKAGNCHFYDCFSKRHKCTDHNYHIKVGKAFCVRLTDNLYKFNAEGKVWMKKTEKCFMEKMLTFYRAETFNCVQGSHKAKTYYSKCSANYGGCNPKILWANRVALKDVYLKEIHGKKSGLAWRVILGFKECNIFYLTKFFGWIRKLVTGGPTHVPSGPPTRILIHMESNSSVRIYWQPPEHGKLNGALLGYMVRYKKDASSDKHVYKRTPRPESHSLQLTGLSPGETYEMSVAAINKKGVGVYSKPRFFTMRNNP